MTDPAPSPPPLSSENPSEGWPLPRVIRKLAALIDHELPPGDVAELRRLSSRDLTALAFWRLAALHLIPEGLLAANSSRSEEQERTWAAILSCMAYMKGLHSAQRSPGHALRDARFSELRLIRLLRSREERLLDNLRGVARYLASKGEAVDWTSLAVLALYPESSTAERTRRRIASDFYAQSPSSSQE
jgi:CRISPR type I-E-associated protein CasB/Cse2